MWMNLLYGLLLSVVSALLAPRPKTEKPKPGELRVPRAKEGSEIGIVFGTVWVQDPQIAWFGHRRTVKIKSSGGKK